jgi:hypothetical protein
MQVYRHMVFYLVFENASLQVVRLPVARLGLRV